MEDVLVVTAGKIREIVDYSSLIDRLRGAFAEFPKFAVPPTTRHAIVAQGKVKQEKYVKEFEEEEEQEAPSLLLMQAWGTLSECPYVLVKSVTVFPGNSSKGLPAVAGTYVLSSLESGKQLAVMDGTELILWRTACTSALAADYLARKNSEVMVMVGAGALAPHLIKAHLTIRPSLQVVFIWNRNHGRALKLVEQLKSSPLATGRHIEAVTDLESAVRMGDVISCATLSREPLVCGEWLCAGSHVDLVGSFTPSMRECDDECIRRCRIVVDSAHAVECSGDLVQPLERGIVQQDHVAGTLAELVQGLSPDLVQGLRSYDDDITLFKSVGCTVGDLAAAQIVFEKLTAP